MMELLNVDAAPKVANLPVNYSVSKVDQKILISITSGEMGKASQNL